MELDYQTPLAVDVPATYRRLRWQIFAVTWLAYAGFYLTRKSFPVAKIGIEQFHGRARFVGATTLAVGPDRLTGRRVLIAAGAVPDSTRSQAGPAPEAPPPGRRCENRSVI